ncbi:MAG: 30S ribosomal protein S2 [Patescibacteria group bacterium]
MQKVENNKNLVEEMFKTGAQYGYSKTRRHPSVSPFIYTTKNKTDIINLEKTNSMLEEASEFIKKLGSTKKIILFVGTKPEAKEAVRNTAESLNMPYVTERWIGGTISNFTEIKKRILELENYKADSTSGELQKYTKKERLVLSKKMEKLARYYTGLLGVKKIPDALFIVDAKTEHIAATEARKCDIPVITLTNSDTNIKQLDYPIVANDASIPSIKFFITQISNAYKAGQMSAPSKE